MRFERVCHAAGPAASKELLGLETQNAGYLISDPPGGFKPATYSSPGNSRVVLAWGDGCPTADALGGEDVDPLLLSNVATR